MPTGTIVHLIITGIVALQPQGALDKPWRIVAPNLSAHNHEPAIYVARAALVNPPAGNAKLVRFPLDASTAAITGVKASGDTSTLPKEILTVDGICPMPAGKCAVLDPAKKPAPALDMTVGAAGISASYLYPSVTWYLERASANPNKWTLGPVAEEICLTFEITTPTFKLQLNPVDPTKLPTVIELRPTVTNGPIELELSNTIRGTPNKHYRDDAHFHLYYESLLKGHVAKDQAKFKNDQTASGTGWRHPGHQHGVETSLVRLSEMDGEGLEPLRKAYHASGKYSIRGSNCPPIVDFP